MSEQNTAAQESEGVEEVLQDDMPPPSYIERLNEFMELKKVNSDEPTYYLYKFDNPTAGRSHTTIDRFYGVTPPDEHDIGLKYGSGRYMMCIMVPKSKKHEKGLMRAYKFKLSPHYDKRMREEQRDPDLMESKKSNSVEQLVQPQIVQQPINQGISVEALLDMAVKILPLITPLLVRDRPKVDNSSAAMKEMYSMVAQMMKESTMETFKLVQDMQRNQIEMVNDKSNSIETSSNDTSIIEKFAPLLAEWVPKILGGGVQGNMLASLVKSAPDVKNLIQDQQQLNAVIAHLVETQGVESTSKLLDKLNIPYQFTGDPAGVPVAADKEVGLNDDLSTEKVGQSASG